MQIARVVGTVVSTKKHRKFEGAKLMLVQPLNMDDTPRGAALLAVDGAGAGVHEKVLVVLEGRAAGEVLGAKAAPVDAAIVGIVDEVDLAPSQSRNCGRSYARPSRVTSITGITAPPPVRCARRRRSIAGTPATCCCRSRGAAKATAPA